MTSKELRKYADILKEENDLITKERMTLAIDADNYELFRFILQAVEPENKLKSTDVEEKGLLMFYDPVQYRRIKELLGKYNIGYEEIGHGEVEKEEDFVNTVSPIPTKNPWWGSN